jgi:hypothetical protein
MLAARCDAVAAGKPEPAARIVGVDQLPRLSALA